MNAVKRGSAPIVPAMEAVPPSSLSSLALLVAPAALVAFALLASRAPDGRPGRTRRAVSLAVLLVLGGAGLSTLLLAVQGPGTSPLLGAHELGLSLRLDVLSVTMTLLVAFLAAILLPFSRTYLEGDPRRGPFLGDLALTLALVLLFVGAGNVVLLALAWVGASLSLQRLLVFRSERPRARQAAHRKFLVARASDLALVLGLVLLVRAFGTGDVVTLLGAARDVAAGHVPGAATAAAVLLALAAVLKSVQLPAHVWLPDTLETPTPVSALLHAGIVNAGGFLVVRFADVVLLAPLAMGLLLALGGITLLFASLVMTTQTTVKARLAWSTIAQMGLMTFQCGLGAFPIAVLHIVAHSLYKAHAFLTSGGVVPAHAKMARAASPRARRVAPFAAGLALALALLLGLDAATGAGLLHKPGASFLAAVLLLGLAPLLAHALEDGRRRHALVPALLLVVGLVLLYLGATGLVTTLFAGTLPSVRMPAPAHALAAVVLLGLAGLSLLQWLAPRLGGSARWAAWRVHLRAGLYVGALFDRLVRPALSPASRGADR